MPQVIRHSYTGELIACAEFEGGQHQAEHDGALRKMEVCEYCNFEVLGCTQCNVVISCCRCGAYHAYECPWPL